MKLFKQIAYPVLAAALVLFFVLSFRDAAGTVRKVPQDMDSVRAHIEGLASEPHSIVHPEGHAKTVSYITDTLRSFGIAEEDVTVRPAFQVQNFTVRDKSTEAYDLTNVIVHIPANRTADRTGNAILFMAHHDSVPMGPGASDDSSSVAVLLESVRYYKEALANGLSIANDLVFAFVDGEEFGLYGSEEYAKNFAGFDGVVSRTEFAVNLESRGASGTLIMFETAKNNYKTVRYFAKVNKSVYTNSIANLVYQSMPNGTDFSNVKDLYQGINLANLGGGESYHTQGDNKSRVGETYLTQMAETVAGVVEYFGNLDLKNLEADEDAVFFTYLNAGTAYYPYWVSYLFGGLTVALLALAVIFALKRGYTSGKKIGLGFAVVGIGIVAAVLAALLLYLVCQLLAAATGVMDIHQFWKVTYSSSGLIVGLLVATAAAVYAAHHNFVKLFRIRGRDAAFSGTLLLGVLSAALAFALPAAAFLFLFTALPALGWLLAKALLHDKFARRFGDDMDKVHAESLLFILSLPLVIPVLTLAASALGMTMCYVLSALFAVCLSYCLPLFADGYPFRFRLGIKEPKPETASAQPKNGHASLGIQVAANVTAGVVAFAGLFVALGFSAFGTPKIYNNLDGKQGLSRYMTDDALSYVVTQSGNYYEVADVNAWLVYKGRLKGYRYDKNLQAYVKADALEKNNSALQYETPVYADNRLRFEKKFDEGTVRVTFSNPEEILRIEAGGVMYEEFTYLGSSNFSPGSGDTSKIVLELRTVPSGEIVIHTRGGAAYTGSIDYVEFVKNTSEMEGFDDWDKVKDLDLAMNALRFEFRVKD